MIAKLPPSVQGGDEPDGSGEELRVRQHRHVRAVADSAEALVPLVLGEPAVVVRPCVDEVRRPARRTRAARSWKYLRGELQNEPNRCAGP